MQHYFYLLKHDVAFFVINFYVKNNVKVLIFLGQDFKFFRSKSGCPTNYQRYSVRNVHWQLICSRYTVVSSGFIPVKVAVS